MPGPLTFEFTLDFRWLYWFICLWHGCFVNIFLCRNSPRIICCLTLSHYQGVHLLCVTVYIMRLFCRVPMHPGKSWIFQAIGCLEKLVWPSGAGKCWKVKISFWRFKIKCSTSIALAYLNSVTVNFRIFGETYYIKCWWAPRRSWKIILMVLENRVVIFCW